MSEKFQAVVIGGGPGGYVCAIRLSQLGLKTACIESRGSLGGTCLNIGCIPSKSLLNLSEEFKKVKSLSSKGIEISDVKLNLSKMMKSKEKAVTVLTKGVEFLLKKNKVTYFKGVGSFKSKNEILIKDDKGKEILINSEKTIIATGSAPTSLPGVKFDEKVIVSSTGALKLEQVPKKMIVIGGGYIGLEMGSVWSRLGADVHVIEFLDHITPGMDKEISNEFMKILKKQGISFHMQHKVESIEKQETNAVISTTDKDGNKKKFECDVVLVSVGRRPNTNGLNLEKIGIELDEKKRIKTNKNFETNIKDIFAIGDVILGPMLAHKAEDEGIAVAENIVGQSGHVNYDTIPGVIYTSPEVAYVGRSEEQLKKYSKGIKVKTKILEIDPEKERIALGIKQLEKDPFVEALGDKIKVGKVVTCVIDNVIDNGLEVSLDNNLQGFIKRTELSRDKEEQKSSRFAKEEKVDALIINVDKNNRKIMLSIKALELADEKQAMQDYGSTDSGASLGDILGAALEAKTSKKESKTTIKKDQKVSKETKDKGKN